MTQTFDEFALLAYRLYHHCNFAQFDNLTASASCMLMIIVKCQYIYRVDSVDKMVCRDLMEIARGERQWDLGMSLREH